MGLFSIFNKKKKVNIENSSEPVIPKTPLPIPKKEIHKVAGVSFRQKEIKSLGFRNDDYSLSKKEIEDFCDDYEKIYQISFEPNEVKLVEEPDNPTDPHAIKVVIDGVHVGYIKKGSCAHIRKLINSGTISSIKANISGGKYKQLIPEDDDKYSIDTETSDFYITLTITLK